MEVNATAACARMFEPRVEESGDRARGWRALPPIGLNGGQSMQMPLQITARDFPSCDALDARIRAKAAKLDETVRVKRGDVKTCELPQRGTVVRLLPEDGCGFSAPGEGETFYFSRGDVVHPWFEDLGIGSEAPFIAEAADNGRQAKRVSVGKYLASP